MVKFTQKAFYGDFYRRATTVPCSCHCDGVIYTLYYSRSVMGHETVSCHIGACPDQPELCFYGYSHATAFGHRSATGAGTVPGSLSHCDFIVSRPVATHSAKSTGGFY